MTFLSKLKKKKNKAFAPKVSAVVAAAGSSSRMEGENKLLMELYNQPVIAHTLMALDQSDCMDEIILVCRSEDMVAYHDICKQYEIKKVTQIICGGETRAHSVLNGILACNKDAAYVAIHDAARPLVSIDKICEVVEKAKETTAATLAVPVKDTIKQVRNGVTVKDLDRASLYSIQTPQVFDIDLIKAALTKALQENITITDDCGAVEALGTNVSIVLGDYDNIKITTKEDIWLAEALLAERGRG